MRAFTFLIGFLFLIFKQGLLAHEVNYQVKEKEGICVSFFFTEGEPMNYAEVEVYSPDEKIVFQKARTDKNGIFCFRPDKAGIWRVVVKGETEHGMHGTKVEVKIGENLSLEGFKKPLVAMYTKFFIALGIIGWIIGLTGIFIYFKKVK